MYPLKKYLWSALLVCVAGTAQGRDVRFTATVVPNLDGGTGTVARGVNNAGWVVGQADSSAGLVGFVFRNGVTTGLPLLEGGSEGKAHSVNDGGTIVGECKNAEGVSRAVVWVEQGGVWTVSDLGTFDDQERGMGVATRINNAGQITGYASTQGPASYHAFLWTAGVMVDQGTLGYSGSLAFSQGLGLSESGNVAGYAYRVLGGPEHGMFVDENGGQDITPAGRFGLAQWHNVNASGVLGGYVAESTLTGGGFRAATYANREFTLVPLIDGLPEAYGYDINDAGTVVGTNFLLAPFPEPNTFLAFAFIDGVTYDLNTVTDGVPGVLTESTDVSNTGLIVATGDNGFAPLAVLLTPAATCRADFNGDGFLDFFDYSEFVACFETGECPAGASADFNSDDFVDFFDYLDYVSAFEAGC